VRGFTNTERALRNRRFEIGRWSHHRGVGPELLDRLDEHGEDLRKWRSTTTSALDAFLAFCVELDVALTLTSAGARVMRKAALDSDSLAPTC
jgi:hypothetical protein